MNGGRKIPRRYLPKSLTESDRRKQLKSIQEGVDRPKVKSFKSKKSKWTILANNYFGDGNTSKRDMARVLARGDKARYNEILKGLNLIFKKAEGAYYTSGSRPNQTKESWGYGRVFSVLFGGPSRKLDKNIVDKYNLPLLRKKQIGKGNKPGDDCPICMEKMNPYTEDLAVSHPRKKEKHYFHFDCLKRHIKTSGDLKCPLCREEIEHIKSPVGDIKIYGYKPYKYPQTRRPPMEQKGKGNDDDDVSYHTYLKRRLRQPINTIFYQKLFNHIYYKEKKYA